MAVTDPVLAFILKDETYNTVTKAMGGAPYSRLSGSRISRIGYALICQRYRELGVPEPSREDAARMAKDARGK